MNAFFVITSSSFGGGGGVSSSEQDTIKVKHNSILAKNFIFIGSKIALIVFMFNSFCNPSTCVEYE